MITLTNVKKKYGTVEAVKGISFTAEKGSVFGLLGPNGAGKSTTIKMIMNIIAPDSGTIHFNGQLISESLKSNIGYLPEERGLYKKLKVNDVLQYFASLKNCPSSEAQKNIDYWLERFELKDWKQAKVSELSKGMSQKVQFITAIAHDPDLLFFDEPFSGLDPVSAETLKDAMIDLGKQNKTILFSTHIMDHAEKICSNIFIINKGDELVSGPTEKIKKEKGTQSIALEFDGDGSFFNSLDYVKNIITYPRYVELELTSMDYANQLISDAVKKVQIKRFEAQTPSLHKIFIDLVGSSGENNE